MSILDPPGARRYPRWMLAPPSWDETWSAAVEASGSTPAWALLLGDSITNGTNGNGTSAYTKGFAELWRANVLARSGVSLYGDHWPAWPFTFGAPAGAVPYAYSGGGANLGGFVKLHTVNATTGTLTFTTPYACTALDVDYCDYASGTFTVTIDGGAPTTVTTTGPGTASGAIMKKQAFTSLANTTHTVVIANASGANVANIAGIDTYASTTGVGFVRQGYSSHGAVDFADSTRFPANMIALWSKASTKINYTSFPIGPSLVVIELGVNDASNFGGFSPVSRTVTDGVSTSGSQGVSSASAAFSIYDVGATISGPNLPSGAYIRPEDGIVSATGANISANATGTGTGQTWTITRPPATVPFEDALRRMVLSFRRAVDDCSILFLAANYPDGVVSDNTGLSRPGRIYHAYKAAIYRVAAEYGCAVLDIDAKWGGQAVAKGFQVNGNIHPLDAGHADIGAACAAIA